MTRTGTDEDMSDRNDSSETDHTIRVLATLNERGPCRVIEIAKVLNIHPVPIDRACTHLQQKGLLQRQPGGTYCVTETGRVVLEKQL
ncbi:MarR family transcriptional regulator [Halocatena salina]|uniref:MarR family transcriptional regulator n=1 Tax=Halocatena salina TaxID=2934340 RepID=UPI0034A2E90F